MVTSGVIVCIFILSSFLFLFSFLAAPGPLGCTFIPSVSLEQPRRLLHRSKQTNSFVPSVGRCSKVHRAAPHPHSTRFYCSAHDPFLSFTTTLEHPGVVLFRPERKQYVLHRSNRSILNPIHLSSALRRSAGHHVPFQILPQCHHCVSGSEW